MATKSKLPVSMPGATAVARPEEDMKWKAKNALDDIKRAEGHKADKNLMKHVKQCAREEMKTLKKL